MDTKSKLFAFKLAAKEETRKETHVATNGSKWQARNGVSIAGCSAPDYRGPRFGIPDTGIFC